MKAPERIETARLVLRRPLAIDCETIYSRFAGDPEVTRFLAWPRHRSLTDTQAFFALSESEWDEWPAGPYLIWSRFEGTLLGSTGLAFETPFRASTGYVFARDAWGRGYATEALLAMAEIARLVGVRRLSAMCHTEHAASCRVLEKCGFMREGVLRQHTEFPNLKLGEPCDVFCYATIL